MKTVYKYTLPGHFIGSGLFTVELPQDAEIIRVGKDLNNKLALWAIVDTEKPATDKPFEIIPTGAPIQNGAQYVGTIDDDGLMWHVFRY